MLVERQTHIRISPSYEWQNGLLELTLTLGLCQGRAPSDPMVRFPPWSVLPET